MPRTLPRQAIRQAQTQRTGRVVNLSAPVGGWNARDSLDRMRSTDAVKLDNWFPDEGEVRIRRGYEEYATNLGGNVEMLAEYHAGATHDFLAAANGKIFDITTSGTATQLASGFSSNRWQTINYNGRMALVNGSDPPQQYAGSAITALSITASGISTVTSFVGVAVHKERSFFWATNSQSFWYSAVNSLGGSLTEFPLSRVGQFGGNLQSVSTWSRDGGAGATSLAVFVMTSGEVIVYDGDNPGDAASWALVGVFRLPTPIAQRGIVDFGGELIITTNQGYFPMSAAFQGTVMPDSAISDKISGAVREVTRDYGDHFGWQAIYYPRGHWLIFNVPIVTNSTYEQHVMNTVTGAWCRFRGMPARTWGVFKEELFFGGNGTVYKADTTNSDGSMDITARAQTAFQYGGSRQVRKQFTAVQPVFRTNGALNFEIAEAIDFALPLVRSPSRSAADLGGDWDTAEWDEASWGGGSVTINRWRFFSAIGYALSIELSTVTNGITVNWYSNNMIVKPAGVI